MEEFLELKKDKVREEIMLVRAKKLRVRHASAAQQIGAQEGETKRQSLYFLSVYVLLINNANNELVDKTIENVLSAPFVFRIDN